MQLSSCGLQAAAFQLSVWRQEMQVVSCGVSGRAAVPRLSPAVAGLTAAAKTKKPAPTMSWAFRRDDAGFVEEEDDMVVLRRRIHEVRAAECYRRPPAGWAAWEKEWYEHGSYDASVRELVGALHAFLLRRRPAVAVGLLAAAALGVPASALLLAGHLLDAARGLASSLHH
ncbi:hypothetical protein ACP4OV_022401 [Aristida adscensionis]